MPLLTPFNNDFWLDADDSHKQRELPIHFDSLAKSAFDFLRHALGEVASKPKYSLIHFYNGLELLFKARLLHEHWALVVSKPESASLSNFINGKFLSVTLQEAIQRLENVAGETVSKDERSSYDKVRHHRNQVVHFFHKGYVAEVPNSEVVGEVTAEQFRAWVHIHKRLTKTWSIHFADFRETISELNDLINGNRQFLAAKLIIVTPEIEQLRNAGSTVVPCDSCGLMAGIIQEDTPPLREARCLVCERLNRAISMKCPECSTEVAFDEGNGMCSNCKTEFTVEDLLAEFSPTVDTSEEPDIAYCPDCERVDHCTVVPHLERYLCLNCAGTFSKLDNCEWCSERVAGDLEDSYLTGCLMCEGKFGDDKD